MAAQTATAPLTETLKWGEPAYLTDRCRTGTTIRLGCVKGPERAAVLFHCRTTLIAEFRDQFGDVFEFEGSRALILPHEADFDPDALAICIARALTYHRDKRKPTL
ncbi:MAG: DUF1801 domain-containing protein [Rhodobacter sp.]|nr:DUF1801 domain-containing protein [Rhodobacter sp.]